MKVCTICKIEKSEAEFSKRGDGKNGLRSNCKQCRNNKSSVHYNTYKEIKAQNYQKNKEKYNAWERNRRKTHITRRLSQNLRNRLNYAIKNNLRAGSAIQDLGCSIEDLKKHLELKFHNHPVTNEPMNWNNYGKFGWHIDHVKPLSGFDLTSRKEFLKANNYSNLQPLWAIENLSKGCSNV